VIHPLEPWISGEIDKGERWGPAITSELDASSFGIICLTPTNLEAPWILFEAGAISKHQQEGRAATLLIGGLTAADIAAPLGQFQHTSTERRDFFGLVKSLNSAVQKVGEKPVAIADLEDIFNRFWPDMEEAFRLAADAEDPPVQRQEREILEEILDLVRKQERARRGGIKISGPKTGARSNYLAQVAAQSLRASHPVDSSYPSAIERALSEGDESSLEEVRERLRRDVAALQGRIAATESVLAATDGAEMDALKRQITEYRAALALARLHLDTLGGD
jgi:hypothetical protein